MKVIITGASGLIGKCLSNQLMENGFDVKFLLRCGRNKQSLEKDLKSNKNIFWSNCEVLENADAVIHLAGANVAGRWTSAYKREILDSRTQGTSELLNACLKCANPPKHIISASGIGIYPEGTNAILTENSDHGSNFLASVCEAWENSLLTPIQSTIKISIVRTGLVLSNQSKIIEAAQKQFLVTGMVGSVGDKNNLWSWIHISDLCNLYTALVTNNISHGIYNAVAPNPCKQGEFGLVYEKYPHLWLPNILILAKIQWTIAKGFNALIRKLNIQWRPTIPAIIMNIAWGERAVIALTNQKVSAQKTLDAGFCYHYPSIDDALNHLQKNPHI